MARLHFTTYALYNAGLQFASNKTGAWYDTDYTSFAEICDTLRAAQVEFGLGDDIEPMCTDFEYCSKELYSESMSEEEFDAICKYSSLNHNEQTCFRYLTEELSYSVAAAFSRYDEVNYSEESAEDYAYQLVQDSYNLDALPPFIQSHIDYKGIARDLLLGGDICEFEDGIITNAHEF